jgi:hypothetical protein
MQDKQQPSIYRCGLYFYFLHVNKTKYRHTCPISLFFFGSFATTGSAVSIMTHTGIPLNKKENKPGNEM